MQGGVVVTGFFNPLIFLPLSVLELGDGELGYILCHEWNHFLARDLWIKVLVDVLCCVFWWNLPIYCLRMDLEQILELNCDRAVTVGMTEQEKTKYLAT